MLSSVVFYLQQGPLTKLVKAHWEWEEYFYRMEILRDIIERDEAKVRFLNRGYLSKGLTLS